MWEKIKMIRKIANDGRLQITWYIWLRFAMPKFLLRFTPQKLQIRSERYPKFGTVETNIKGVTNN